VLDYGCGDALYAENVAGLCGQLLLFDAAPRIREALAMRLTGRPGIEVLDAPGVEGLAGASLDLIVVNSVLQYLTREQLADLLELWRVKLKTEGRLVVADVVPPNIGPLQDAVALLRFAAEGGFVRSALAGLARTALSDYGRVRRRVGFSTYTERDVVDLLAAHGLDAKRVHPNFGHNPARMTFEVRRIR
jgi:ubiquinone/menaquinone biosynthesis C-methylase UbiE